MPDGGGDLWIANTISDLIQGDVNEHLPLEAIPLQGDVLGLGTTTSVDNGELTFDYQMKPGVVRHTNGLALMRAVGIEV